MRSQANCTRDETLRRVRLDDAYNLLVTTTADLAAAYTDNRASLVLARIERARGNTQQALAACERALELEPTGNAWLLKLQLSDEQPADCLRDDSGYVAMRPILRP